MEIDKIVDLWGKIKTSWEKKSALFLLLLLFNYVAYKLLFDKDAILGDIGELYKILIILVVNLFISTVWIFTTNRFFIKGVEKFSLGLMIWADEDQAEFKIRRIVSRVAKEINEEYPKIKVRLFPINYCTGKGEVEKYLKYRPHSIDAIIFCKVESGNFKTNNSVEQRIQLNHASFIGNFNVYEYKKIFNSTINMAQDLQIRLLHKDWAYVEENSGIDKNKLRANFKDTILHYSGLYLVYLNEYDLASNILKSLYNPTATRIKSENGQIKMTKENLAACRLSNILLNLFSHNAIEHYLNKNDIETAYSLLIECENTFKHHAFTYSHCISLARFSYELGKLDDAKNYTAKAQGIKGDTMDTLLNKAFFNIIDGNANKLAGLYKQIRSKGRKTKNYNYIQIVEFLDNEKNRIENRDEYFEFSESSLYKLFIDEQDGNQKLDSFIEKYSDNVTISSLIEVAKVFRSINNVQREYNSAPKKSNPKRKKRRVRR